jgi:hypothetical protein
VKGFGAHTLQCGGFCKDPASSTSTGDAPDTTSTSTASPKRSAESTDASASFDDRRRSTVTGTKSSNKGDSVSLLTRLARQLNLGATKTRAPPSGANPSTLVDRRIDTEDDVLFVPNLPDFGDRLRARDCEVLLQYLTVPYMRIPLVLQFFADPVKMQALWLVFLSLLLTISTCIIKVHLQY